MLPGGPSYEQAWIQFSTVAWPERSQTRPVRFKDSALCSRVQLINASAGKYSRFPNDGGVCAPVDKSVLYVPMVSKVQGAIFNLAEKREALFKLILGHGSPNSTNVNNPPLLLREEGRWSDHMKYLNTHFYVNTLINVLTMAFSLDLFTFSMFVLTPWP